MKALKILAIKLARSSLWPSYLLLLAYRGQNRPLAAKPGHSGLRTADHVRNRILRS